MVITGEENTYRGVKPRTNFGEGGPGAWELAARYGRLDIDDEAFRLGFANPSSAARTARSFGVSLNWYLNRHVKAVLGYDHTESGVQLAF